MLHLVALIYLLTCLGPSHAPPGFSLAPLNSTTVCASWQLPPPDSIHGIIMGFKLLHRIKGSSDPLTVMTIGINSTLSTDVTGLHKYTKYEFQVLAFSSVGNGPSSVKEVRTNEDG